MSTKTHLIRSPAESCIQPTDWTLCELEANKSILFVLISFKKNIRDAVLSAGEMDAVLMRAAQIIRNETQFQRLFSRL